MTSHDCGDCGARPGVDCKPTCPARRGCACGRPDCGHCMRLIHDGILPRRSH